MTVEKPDTRVVGNKAKGNAYARIDDDNVTSHWGGGCGVQAGPLRFVASAIDDLEGVTVEMERMGPSIVVVEVNFNNGAVGDYLRVDLAIDGRVGLILAGRAKGSEECRYLLAEVCLSVYSGAVGTPVIGRKVYR